MEVLLVVIVVLHIIGFAVAAWLFGARLNALACRLRTLTQDEWEELGETAPRYVLSGKPFSFSPPLWAARFGEHCIRSNPIWASRNTELQDSVRSVRRAYHVMLVIGLSLAGSVVLILWKEGAL